MAGRLLLPARKEPGLGLPTCMLFQIAIRSTSSSMISSKIYLMGKFTHKIGGLDLSPHQKFHIYVAEEATRGEPTK
jgi:hypothetical protein